MKKILFSLLFLALIGEPILAQKKASSSPSSALECYYMRLPSEPGKENFTLPFSFIEIVDARYDSSKLGFHRNLTGWNASRMYCMKTGVQQELQSYFNNYYKPNLDGSSPNQLLVCLKKLWLSDFDESELQTNQKNTELNHLYYKAEIYYHAGEKYFPVQRIDSVFVITREPGYTPPGFLQEAFQYTIDQVRQKDFAAIAAKRNIDRQRLDSFNHSFASPILKDTSFKRGVYASFADFKNNQPSWLEFEFQPGKLTDILYVKDADGKFYVKREVWGYSDGTNIFIRMGLNYFPLVRVNQTWEFYGTNSVVDRKQVMPMLLGAMPGPSIAAGRPVSTFHSGKGKSSLSKLRPFAIDMETGAIY